MKKEEITVLAQLLTAIKDAVEKLEEAMKEKNSEKIASLKKEILVFQRKMGEIL